MTLPLAPQSSQLPFVFAKKQGVLPLLEAEGKTLHCIARSPINWSAVGELQRVIGRSVEQVIEVTEAEFEHRLTSAYQSDSSETLQMVQGIGDQMDLASLADSVADTEDLLDQQDDAPIIKLINGLLQEAIRESVSDIHIETFEKRLVVRFRVDGVLRPVVEPKRALAPLLISRIKVMAKLDIAEKRLPQDGRISLRLGGREVDVRVSTMPSSNGERVVLRILDKNAGRMDLAQLGMSSALLGNLKQLLYKPHGIFLVTGPTGSGKTTTLYASLTELNDSCRNIMTVEDPIEYNLEGIGQTQVNPKVDMTFARGLRAMLRQDPDVVMVGEIRDTETADIAVQASLTGHLVLSTLHTNTAAGAITRLQDMGVEPFLLASSLLGVLAQRLVRVLCPDCKTPAQPDASECRALGVSEQAAITIYHAVGCERCNQQGYRGRTGIYELLTVDDEIRSLIHNNAGEQSIERYLRPVNEQGITQVNTPSIRHDGIRLVWAGITTLEEVLRVTRED
ncbi:general secretion pathway protein E [Oceanospirillum multiglobuliferum]|nr:general secretion pathway protein E [Oceanospirillum multiglobuliferum]